MHSQYGVLFNSQKEWATNSCNNIEDSYLILLNKRIQFQKTMYCYDCTHIIFWKKREHCKDENQIEFTSLGREEYWPSKAEKDSEATLDSNVVVDT